MLIKCPWVGFLAIGGLVNEITPLHLSAWNFGATSGELLSFGSDDFYYFLVNEEKYILARAKNKVINWPYSYKGKLGGRCVFKLAVMQAKKELAKISEEQFLNKWNTRGYEQSEESRKLSLTYS